MGKIELPELQELFSAVSGVSKWVEDGKNGLIFKLRDVRELGKVEVRAKRREVRLKLFTAG